MKRAKHYIFEIIQTIRNIIAVPIIGVGLAATALGTFIMDGHF